MRHFAVNYKNANRLNETCALLYSSGRMQSDPFHPAWSWRWTQTRGQITILAVAPGALQSHASPFMDSWCVIPPISGDATAPPLVSRASPTALLSPVTYLGGFFKKIPKKAFSFLVSSHHSVIEQGGETADWKAWREEGYSRNWWQTHEKVDPAEVRHRHEPVRRGIRSASGRSSHDRSGRKKQLHIIIVVTKLPPLQEARLHSYFHIFPFFYSRVAQIRLGGFFFTKQFS